MPRTIPAPTGRVLARLSRHRLPATVLAGVVATGTLSVVAISARAAAPATVPTAAPAAAPAGPVFTLVNNVPTATARRVAGSPAFVYLDGLALVAGPKPVLFTASRSTYAKPVVTTMAVGTTKRTLPAKLAGLQGLRNVFTITAKNAAGRTVGTESAGTCPSSGGSGGRTRPDAPDSSPYPSYCSAGPFALRTAYGVQAGWASGVLVAAMIDGPDGVYTVSTSVSPAWRTLFGIPAAKATVTTKVTVATVEDDEEGEEGAAAGHAHGAAAAHGPTAGASLSHSAWLASPQGRAASPLQRLKHAETVHAVRLAELAAASRLTSGAPGVTAVGPGGAREVAARAVAAPLRPDLRSLPAFSISLLKGSDLDEGIDPKLKNHEFLTFAATTWNAGPAPLVVEGFRRPGKDVMDAYEYFYAKGKQVSYTKVGTMEYDRKRGHEHWHFKDFAQYNLLDSRQRAKLRSGKEAWCLAPTDSVDLLQPGAVWNPGATGLGSACGSEEARTIREVMPSGWGDTYGQYLPGQSFDVTGLPNGTYYIEVLANPDKRLIEVSTTNNRSLRKVVISGPAGNRKVTVPPYQGIDTEAIDPDLPPGPGPSPAPSPAPSPGPSVTASPSP